MKKGGAWRHRPKENFMQFVNNAPVSGAQDHNAPLVGLRVRLRPCAGVCGCVIATVVTGAAVACASCGRRRARLDSETQRFLRDFVAIFGRPTAPIEIRPPQAVSTETSPQPSGAGADDVINAPEKAIRK
jgi:hypothetical protein